MFIQEIMSNDYICSRFVTVVEEYLEIQNGYTSTKLRDVLNVITNGCCINQQLFKTTVEKSHFLLSVRIVLIKIGICCDYSLLMLALKAISKLCSQSELKNELIETQDILLILVELLEKLDNIEANFEILNLMQEITFNLRHRDEDINVNKLVSTLAIFIKCQPTEQLLFSALACLINLCQKNSMALQKLNKLLNLTEFAKLLLAMRCKTLSSKVHGFHMLLLTWFETGKRHYEEEDVSTAIDIIYDAIENTYTNGDLHLFKYTMDLFTDMAEDNKHIQDIIAYPKHAEKVSHLIKHVTPTAGTSDYTKEILLFLHALISNINPEPLFDDIISACSVFISNGNNKLNTLNLCSLMLHRLSIYCDQRMNILTEDTVLVLLKMTQEIHACTELTNTEFNESYEVCIAILKLYQEINHRTDSVISFTIELLSGMMEKAMEQITVESVNQAYGSCGMDPIVLSFHVEVISYAKFLENRYNATIFSKKLMVEEKINYILVMGILHGDETTTIRAFNFLQSSLNIEPVIQLLVKYQSSAASTNKIMRDERGFDELLYKKSKFCRRLKDAVKNTDLYLLKKNKQMNAMQPYLMDISKMEEAEYALKSSNKQNRYRATMLEREVCTAEKELDVITDRTKILDNEKKDLVSQLNSNEHLIHQIQSLQLKTQENLERWEISILDLDSRLEHEQSQVMMSNKCIEQLNNSIDNLKCMIEQKDIGITEINSKIAACDGVIVDLEVTIVDKEREISTHLSKIAIITDSLTEKNEEALKVEVQITELQRLRDAINSITSACTSYS